MINRRRLQRNLRSHKQPHDWSFRSHRVEKSTTYILTSHIPIPTVFTVRGNPDKIILTLKSCLCLVEKTLPFTPQCNEHGLILQCLMSSSMSHLWLNGNASLERLWEVSTWSSPGEEVLQWPGLILFRTENTISLLLLHLSNARREGVNVVKDGLHGNGNLVGLLWKFKKGNMPVILTTNT